MSGKKEHQTRSRAASTSAKTGSNLDLNGSAKIPEVKTEDTTSLFTTIETVVTQPTSNEEHFVQVTGDLNPIDENIDDQFENDDEYDNENHENHEDLNSAEITSQNVELQKQVDELTADVKNLFWSSENIQKQVQIMERASFDNQRNTGETLANVVNMVKQLQEEMLAISSNIQTLTRQFQSNHLITTGNLEF